MLKTWIRPNVIDRQALVALEKLYFVELRILVLVLQLLDSEMYKNCISSIIENLIIHIFFLILDECENACCEAYLELKELFLYKLFTKLQTPNYKTIKTQAKKSLSNKKCFLILIFIPCHFTLI